MLSTMSHERRERERSTWAARFCQEVGALLVRESAKWARKDVRRRDDRHSWGTADTNLAEENPEDLLEGSSASSLKLR